MGKDMSIQARVISNTRNQTFRSNSSTTRIAIGRTPSVLYNDFEQDEFYDEEDIAVAEAVGIDGDLDITQFVSDNTQNYTNATQEMYGIMRAVSS
jgi:hypothetical protein